MISPLGAPGHLLRRAQQVHTDSWAVLVPCVTGPQYAVLVVVNGWDNIDQKTAGVLASLDKATAAGVVGRLVKNGWLERAQDDADRRRRLLRLTDRASADFPAISRAARDVQTHLLSPLPAGERHLFVEQLGAVARINDLPVQDQTDSVHGLRLAYTPGYLLRRAQQFHTGQWATMVPDVTGPQYAVLWAIAERKVATHTEIATLASLDSSTTLDIVRRLTARGWIVPVADVVDKRSRPVRLAEPAITALRFIEPAVSGVQARLIEPLTETAQTQFIDNLRLVARLAPGSHTYRTHPTEGIV